ncbi:uncharacterized protein PgNI_04339 [Pyricularia grisea]|uniref:DUF7492 domain-containing protein n=1 Tax=Pyricularia grisea TaxID=148305 RepID=A0A6P8B9N1_PYRGI|nr:uncharacterized protein PgNI_04339 [Pyricularia grisea]TLD12530.1 hypothetical protein PgNI_04339 [Pyricularia grisea]
MKFVISTSGALSALLLLAGEATAHSWPETIQRIGKKGEFLEPKGYTRNFRPREGREDENFSKNLGGPNDPIKGPLCNPALGTKADGYKNAKYPKLKAAPGEMIAIRYLENGHVTGPDLKKPTNRGTVYIYATTEPRDGQAIQDVHKKWTADGQGGDKKGRLLAMRNYDDGRCFEGNNNKDESKRRSALPGFTQPGKDSSVHNWCQNDIKLPADIKKGDLTIYWVWDFSLTDKENTAKTSDDLNGAKVVSKEFYSSCMEIALDESIKSNEPFQFDEKQNFKDAADPKQLTMGLPDGAPKGGAAATPKPKEEDKKDDKPKETPKDNKPKETPKEAPKEEKPKETPKEAAPKTNPPAATTTNPPAAVPTTFEKQVKTVTVTQGVTTVTVTAGNGAQPTTPPAAPAATAAPNKDAPKEAAKETPKEATKDAPKENNKPVTTRPQEVDPIPMMLLRRGQRWFGAFHS